MYVLEIPFPNLQKFSSNIQHCAEDLHCVKIKGKKIKIYQCSMYLKMHSFYNLQSLPNSSSSSFTAETIFQ